MSEGTAVVGNKRQREEEQEEAKGKQREHGLAQEEGEEKRKTKMEDDAEEKEDQTKKAKTEESSSSSSSQKQHHHNGHPTSNKEKEEEGEENGGRGGGEQHQRKHEADNVTPAFNELFERLRKHFKVVNEPATPSQIQQFEQNYPLTDEEKQRDGGIVLPRELKQFYLFANGMNRIGCEFWCFGDNFYPLEKCGYKTKKDIFGDEGIMKEWRKEKEEKELSPGGSCASPGWILFGASSEFDYYFINCAPNSPFFGQVRHIVNNCNEDELLAPSFQAFIQTVTKGMEQRRSTNNKEEDEQEWNLLEFFH
ncbi:hypothetical protein QOT17_024741 [Balamuthia mandrillaris]